MKISGDDAVNNEVGQNISEMNLDLIYSLFYRNEYLSKPQVVELSKLSTPTVSGHIKTLEEEGLITQVKTLSSRGGRPAIAYGIVSDCKVAIGVDVLEDMVRIGLIDLKGKMLFKNEYPLVKPNSEKQFKYLISCINNFIEVNQIERQKILGVGISVQAVIAINGQDIIYSRISSLDGFNACNLSSELGLKVRLFHDVESAALSELWFSSDISNACYVSLSEHIGGSLIKHHKIEHGKNGYAGALEHLCVVPDGLPCYCGHKGCLETYCSLNALKTQCAAAKLSITQLFEIVHDSGNSNQFDLSTIKQAQEIWEQYLKHLSHALYIVYLLLERDIVLGGKMASYFSQQDIDHLEKLIIEQGSFSISPKFIRVANVLQDAALIGAGLYFIACMLPNIVVPVKI